jgi:hypothetical protein
MPQLLLLYAAATHAVVNCYSCCSKQLLLLTMTAHDRMLQAKSLAKDHFEVRKIYTTARADPPGGQNINKMKFKRCLTENDAAWRTFYDAAMTLTNRETFAEEAERIEARDRAYRLSLIAYRLS